jgi:site-specific DNA-methyltransferase (adenine-specific)/modification methylase
MKFPDDYLIPGVKPFHVEEAGIIYCADCRDILPHLPKVDLVLTDPPYGIEGGTGGMQHDYSKSDYSGLWTDDEKYIKTVCVPIIEKCLNLARTLAFTPGTTWLCSYPQPKDVGCFFTPSSPRTASFGFQSCHPIFYYGWYKDGGKNNNCSGKILTESAEKNGHPCPKPIKAWKWLLERLSEANNIILDPFLGSGTTALAAKELGRKFIGIEISEEYCRIAVKRLRQGVLNFG